MGSSKRRRRAVPIESGTPVPAVDHESQEPMAKVVCTKVDQSIQCATMYIGSMNVSRGAEITWKKKTDHFVISLNWTHRSRRVQSNVRLGELDCVTTVRLTPTACVVMLELNSDPVFLEKHNKHLQRQSLERTVNYCVVAVVHGSHSGLPPLEKALENEDIYITNSAPGTQVMDVLGKCVMTSDGKYPMRALLRAAMGPSAGGKQTHRVSGGHRLSRAHVKLLARLPSLGPSVVDLTLTCDLEGGEAHLRSRAREMHVSEAEWLSVVAQCYGTTTGNQDDALEGYDPELGGRLKRSDFLSLMPGGRLTDEVMDELSRRILVERQDILYLDSWTNEMMCPQADGADGEGGRLPTDGFWNVRAGGHRLIGREVKAVVGVHFTPEHWCFELADFDERHKMIYYDPLLGAKHADRSMLELGRYLQRVCDAQGYTAHRPTDFALEKWIDGPLQPDGYSCGVCVLMVLEMLAAAPTLEAFYAAIAARGKREWTEDEINRARARWACDLLHRPNGASGEQQAVLVAARLAAAKAQVAEFEAPGRARGSAEEPIEI